MLVFGLSGYFRHTSALVGQLLALFSIQFCPGTGSWLYFLCSFFVCLFLLFCFFGQPSASHHPALPRSSKGHRDLLVSLQEGELWPRWSWQVSLIYWHPQLCLGELPAVCCQTPLSSRPGCSWSLARMTGSFPPGVFAHRVVPHLEHLSLTLIFS